jgi:type IV secretion system protein VirB4
MYRRFGLSDRQIDIIADATPKRHYYYASPLGRRLFDLALEPATLSFVGASSKEDILKARGMMREYGDNWPAQWLRSRGLREWAEYWEKLWGEHDQRPSARLFRNGAAAVNGNSEVHFEGREEP